MISRSLRHTRLMVLNARAITLLSCAARRIISSIKKCDRKEKKRMKWKKSMDLIYRNERHENYAMRFNWKKFLNFFFLVVVDDMKNWNLNSLTLENFLSFNWFHNRPQTITDSKHDLLSIPNFCMQARSQLNTTRDTKKIFFQSINENRENKCLKENFI